MDNGFDGIHLDLSIAQASMISMALQYKLVDSDLLSDVGKYEYKKIIATIEETVTQQSGHPISYWKV